MRGIHPDDALGQIVESGKLMRDKHILATTTAAPSPPHRQDPDPSEEGRCVWLLRNPSVTGLEHQASSSMVANNSGARWLNERYKKFRLADRHGIMERRSSSLPPPLPRFNNLPITTASLDSRERWNEQDETPSQIPDIETGRTAEEEEDIYVEMKEGEEEENNEDDEEVRMDQGHLTLAMHGSTSSELSSKAIPKEPPTLPPAFSESSFTRSLWQNVVSVIESGRTALSKAVTDVQPGKKVAAREWAWITQYDELMDEMSKGETVIVI